MLVGAIRKVVRAVRMWAQHCSTLRDCSQVLLALTLLLFGTPCIFGKVNLVSGPTCCWAGRWALRSCTSRSKRTCAARRPCPCRSPPSTSRSWCAPRLCVMHALLCFLVVACSCTLMHATSIALAGRSPLSGSWCTAGKSLHGGYSACVCVWVLSNPCGFLPHAGTLFSRPDIYCWQPCMLLKC